MITWLKSFGLSDQAVGTIFGALIGSSIVATGWLVTAIGWLATGSQARKTEAYKASLAAMKADREIARKIASHCRRQAIRKRWDDEMSILAMYESLSEARVEIQKLVDLLEDPSKRLLAEMIISEIESIEEYQNSSSLSTTWVIKIDMAKQTIRHLAALMIV